MFNKKAPLYFVLILIFVSIISTYFITSAFFKNSSQIEPTDASLRCNITLSRLNGYRFVKPLLFAEENCQSPELSQVRSEVENIISSFKSSGTIKEASVYLRDLNKGHWIAIGETEKYFPGSLIKVPELITFMKMNEKTPGILNKKIIYTKALISEKKAHYISKSIQPGNTYTIRELLHYMIAYSDNNATMVLNNLMDMNLFKKVFTDLGLAEPDLTAKDIPVTVKQFSLFMRAIYNASYLTIEDSEYCAELLSHTDFSSGLVDGLPKNMIVAHKFGEAGDQFNAQFSESGIVYIQNDPYLLTVMTKGKDMKELPGVIRKISGNVYNRFTQM